MTHERAIKIAISALGGQGGGVLADWIVKVAERAGYIAQSTSVPGVAQRTGATVYYVELFPESAAIAKGKPPVLALMPLPGDVDIVLAAELMEAGRAITRGLVSSRTTLIASTHRDYAVGEKIAMSDARRASEPILEIAEKYAGRFIAADMAEAASEAGAVISAVMFGALAGSGALPIARNIFEETIRETGRAVEKNLMGFEKGIALAGTAPARSPTAAVSTPDGAPPSRAVAPLVERLTRDFPPATHAILREGLKRTVDYQDVRHGGLYLDRLTEILALDKANGGEARHWRLTAMVGKFLALSMSYEDAIRVADLKTRASRFRRFREDVRAAEGQIVHVSEYLHPRIEEVCDLLPAGLARFVLSTPALRKTLSSMLGKGRRVPTTKLRGFFMLSALSSLRGARRGTYRYKIEEGRIAAWLDAIKAESSRDYALACALAELQRLIKGYGETHERGLASYARILSALDAVKRQPDPARALLLLRDAALKDEEGLALTVALKRLEARPSVAA